MSDGQLVLSKVQIHRGAQRLLSVDFTVDAGQIYTVMGPSGIGKSTLLAHISGTLPDAFRATGSIMLNGVNIDPIPPQKRKIGMLFQDDLLFPHMSVGQNLAFGLAGIRGRALRRAAVMEALASVGLDGYVDADPMTLSGGQKARVSLMRTLLSQPSALLLDEPFSRLDAGLRSQIRDLVFHHVATRKLPTIMVTHDIEDARAAGGPILELG